MSWDDSAGGYITEKVCPVCGKKFVTMVADSEWVYHYRRQKDQPCVCSWSCCRKSEKQKPPQNQDGGNRLKVADDIPLYLKDLLAYQKEHCYTIDQICDRVGICRTSLQKFYRGTTVPSYATKQLIVGFLEAHDK